jgi:secreted Zn-dependent insulinase-like peptidase
VLEAVFSYLSMMRREGPSERIYGEIQKIEDLNFHFHEESQPVDNVEALCDNMQVRYLIGLEACWCMDCVP